jgi:hypothetical protein
LRPHRPLMPVPLQPVRARDSSLAELRWVREESTVLGVDDDGIAIPMICRRVVGAAGYGQFELSFLRLNRLATGAVPYRIS